MARNCHKINLKGEMDIMNIIEVLKEENVGKKYVSDGMELILVRGFSTLWLQDEKT